MKVLIRVGIKKILALLILSIGLPTIIYAISSKQMEESCNKGISNMSCVTMASKYLVGKDVKQDINKAIKFYTKACEYGDDVDCLHLAKEYHSGKKIKQD